MCPLFVSCMHCRIDIFGRCCYGTIARFHIILLWLVVLLAVTIFFLFACATCACLRNYQHCNMALPDGLGRGLEGDCPVMRAGCGHLERGQGGDVRVLLHRCDGNIVNDRTSSTLFLRHHPRIAYHVYCASSFFFKAIFWAASVKAVRIFVTEGVRRFGFLRCCIVTGMPHGQVQYFFT